MKNHEEILFCNDAFYQAFWGRDMKVMRDVWASINPVACIHPGSSPLTELRIILASWRSIFQNPNCPRIVHQTDEVLFYGDVALVTCYEWDERQPENVLLATNGFARESGTYRMVFHQAGASPAPPERPTESRPPMH
ncbi:MAG TPA: DUF4440 domain-containing protein [Porticoccaceae bacterium]|nr:DUF4440 domain-containing protein [Porticoccaceae bacterium]